MMKNRWTIEIYCKKKLSHLLEYIISVFEQELFDCQISKYICWQYFKHGDSEDSLLCNHMNLEFNMCIDAKVLYRKFLIEYNTVNIIPIEELMDGCHIIDSVSMYILDCLMFPESELKPLLDRKRIMCETHTSTIFFITIPKYDTTTLYNLTDMTKEYLNLHETKTIGEIWVKEFHKDGEPHIHGLIDILKPISIDINIYSSFFKSVSKKSKDRIIPNTQCVRSESAVTKYLAKVTKIDSKNILYLGKYKDIKKGAKYSILTDCMEWLLSGKKGLSDIINDPNISTLDKVKLLPKISQFASIEKMIQIPDRKIKFHLPKKPTHAKHLIIWKWLKKLLNGKLKASNEKHLFIIGPTRIGKSTFVKYLQTCFKTYSLDNSGWFTSDYKDDIYDLAICDEFSPLCEKSYAVLNLFLRGTKQDNFQVKNGHIKKTKHIPCLFLTNYSQKLYEEKDPVGAGPFFERFHIVTLDHTIPLPLDFRDYYYTSNIDVSSEINDIYDIVIKANDYFLFFLGDRCLVRKIDYNGIYIDFFDIENSIKSLNMIERYKENEISTQYIYVNFANNIVFDCEDGTLFKDPFYIQDNIAIYGNNFSNFLKKYQIFDDKYNERFIISESSMHNLQEYVYYFLDGQDNIEDCCICKSDAMHNDFIILPCSHTIHYDCWLHWVSNNGIMCVICRREFSPHKKYFPVMKNELDVKFLIPSKEPRVRVLSESCILKEYYTNGIGICECNQCSF